MMLTFRKRVFLENKMFVPGKAYELTEAQVKALGSRYFDTEETEQVSEDGQKEAKKETKKETKKERKAREAAEKAEAERLAAEAAKGQLTEEETRAELEKQALELGYSKELVEAAESIEDLKELITG